MTWSWSVTYETATVARGEAETRREAERLCDVAHTTLLLKGLAPDKLGYFVSEVQA